MYLSLKCLDRFLIADVEAEGQYRLVREPGEFPLICFAARIRRDAGTYLHVLFADSARYNLQWAGSELRTSAKSEWRSIPE
jgi:hypothetical protein